MIFAQIPRGIPLGHGFRGIPRLSVRNFNFGNDFIEIDDTKKIVDIKPGDWLIMVENNAGSGFYKAFNNFDYINKTK